MVERRAAVKEEVVRLEAERAVVRAAAAGWRRGGRWGGRWR